MPSVDVFEAWLGVVVVAVMVTGLVGRAQWVPRIGLITGVLALLGTAAINPDAWVADRNIDRFEESGRLDVFYLQSLSADAAPVIVDRLPELEAACAVQRQTRARFSSRHPADVWSWNLGRARAAQAIDELSPETLGPSAPRDPCGPAYDELASLAD